MHDPAAESKDPQAERVTRPVHRRLGEKPERIAAAAEHVQSLRELVRGRRDLLGEPRRHAAEHQVRQPLGPAAAEVEHHDRDERRAEHGERDVAGHADLRDRDRQPDDALGERIDRRHEQEHDREQPAEEHAVDHALGDDRARRRRHRQPRLTRATILGTRAQHVRARELADAKRQQQDREITGPRHGEQAAARDLDDATKQKPSAHRAEPHHREHERHVQGEHAELHTREVPTVGDELQPAGLHRVHDPEGDQH